MVAFAAGVGCLAIYIWITSKLLGADMSDEVLHAKDARAITEAHLKSPTSDLVLTTLRAISCEVRRAAEQGRTRVQWNHLKVETLTTDEIEAVAQQLGLHGYTILNRDALPAMWIVSW